MINSAKAVVDIMLGVLSITNGARTLDAYLADMKARGQGDDRIAEVRTSLADIGELASTAQVDVASIPTSGRRTAKRKAVSTRT